jgi:hypothetical protein
MLVELMDRTPVIVILDGSCSMRTAESLRSHRMACGTAAWRKRMKFLLLHTLLRRICWKFAAVYRAGFSATVRAVERKAIAASWLHQKSFVRFVSAFDARICAAAPARRGCQGSSLRLGGVGVTSGILIRWRMERSMRRRTGLGSRLAGHGGERLQPRRNYQPVPCRRLTSPTPVCWRQAPSRLVTPTRTPSRPSTSAAPLPTPAHRHRRAADMAFVDRRYHVPALPCCERKIRVFTVWLTTLGGRFADRNPMRLLGIGVVALPTGWLLFAVGAGNSVAAFGFMSAITRPPASDQRPLKPAAGFWRIPDPPL